MTEGAVTTEPGSLFCAGSRCAKGKPHGCQCVVYQSRPLGPIDCEASLVQIEQHAEPDIKMNCFPGDDNKVAFVLVS